MVPTTTTNLAINVNSNDSLEICSLSSFFFFCLFFIMRCNTGQWWVSHPPSVSLNVSLVQCFSTTVPRHSTVLWRSVRCAAGNHPISHNWCKKPFFMNPEITCCYEVSMTLELQTNHVTLFSISRWQQVGNNFVCVACACKVTVMAKKRKNDASSELESGQNSDETSEFHQNSEFWRNQRWLVGAKSLKWGNATIPTPLCLVCGEKLCYPTVP